MDLLLWWVDRLCPASVRCTTEFEMSRRRVFVKEKVRGIVKTIRNV